MIFLLDRAIACFSRDVGHEIGEGLGTEIVFVAMTHRDGLFLFFFLTDDEHVRHAIEACVADFGADFVGVAIQAYADFFVGELRGDFLGVFHVFIRDRQHADLLGGEPGGEFSFEVLDEQAGETFERAEGGAVNHYRAMGAIVLADVAEIESLWEVVVDLHGAELPVTTDDVFDHEVDLWSIEGGFAEFFAVFDTESLHGLTKGVFGFLPVFVRTDVFAAVFFIGIVMKWSTLG